MKLQDLRPAEGSTHAPKRVGRGIGSGLGKTSAKGHKGQKARSGGGKGPAFEGGQTPLQRRLPKRGFTNIFRKEFVTVNVDSLNVFENGADVTPETLKAQGLIKSTRLLVKILGEGELKKRLTVRVQGYSKSAVAKIEAAGGKAEVI